MGAIIFFNFYLLTLKVFAENQCEKHKKSSLIVYNASKDSVISMLGNTLIPIFVFDRKTLSLSLFLSNSNGSFEHPQHMRWLRYKG